VTPSETTDRFIVRYVDQPRPLTIHSSVSRRYVNETVITRNEKSQGCISSKNLEQQQQQPRFHVQTSNIRKQLSLVSTPTRSNDNGCHFAAIVVISDENDDADERSPPTG
jgi:hypothetical protein